MRTSDARTDVPVLSQVLTKRQQRPPQFIRGAKVLQNVGTRDDITLVPTGLIDDDPLKSGNNESRSGYIPVAGDAEPSDLEGASVVKVICLDHLLMGSLHPLKPGIILVTAADLAYFRPHEPTRFDCP